MIECIPNFSEGRRREVIDSIAAAIAGVPGAVVLDIHADPDHNRSVITFAGDAGAVAEAAFQAVRAAASLIDMTAHRGQHPRVGAADVVPFVPLRGATLEQCVALARAVGRRIGQELAIPVYLYEAAATRPDRVALPNLRRGEYEGLRDAIEHDPERAPDFGPARIGTAGATIVGARRPLIAYNVYLNTADVSVARRVARAVRGSSGGLRGVRALGLLVNGRAQVSMNLIDYRTTPLHRALDMVAREAAAFGASIAECELVGLIPEDALIDTARFHLRLHTMRDDQVLERRLALAMNDEGRK
jgi:glutamate formiminotransferase